MPRSSLSNAVRVLLLISLFVAAAFLELARGSSLSSIANGDFWWHLSTGIGILETHSLPRNGWFSQSAALPWRASSWLYDVMVALGYQMLNVRVLPLLAVIGKFALALATFVLAGGLRGRFWTAAALSAIAQYLLGGIQPLPLACSVVALCIELALLMAFRREPATRAIWFVPGLFLLWANLDQHFVYGVLTLVWFSAACAIQQWAARKEIDWPKTENSLLPLRTLAAITGASLLVTFMTPYGWSGYSTFWTNATSAANPYFPHFQSLRFRIPQDYVVMLLAMAAFLSLGIRRSRDLFQVGLLVLCLAAAFHSQRDTWLVVLAAVAIIGNAALQETAASGTQRVTSLTLRASGRPFLVAAGLSLVIVLATFVVRGPSREGVLIKIGQAYPVAAADYIRQNKLPAPLFNSFSWGGFLTWYLPQYPVAIDGRTDLYGADTNIQYAKVMNFEAHYSTYPALNDAATILVEKNSPAGRALPGARGFSKAYEDNVAVVLLRDKAEP